MAALIPRRSLHKKDLKEKWLCSLLSKLKHISTKIYKECKAGSWCSTTRKRYECLFSWIWNSHGCCQALTYIQIFLFPQIMECVVAIEKPVISLMSCVGGQRFSVLNFFFNNLQRLVYNIWSYHSFSGTWPWSWSRCLLTGPEKVSSNHALI